MMPTLKLCLLLVLGAAASLHAAAPPAADWNRAIIGPMKTSIYVGSVTLIPEPFVRSGAALAANYQVKVWPWFFWGETGHISLTLTDANLASLARGETTEFTGEATSHKNRLRKVTGRAQPADAVSGKIKVRILADGYDLIFNGTYRFENAPLPAKPADTTVGGK